MTIGHFIMFLKIVILTKKGNEMNVQVFGEALDMSQQEITGMKHSECNQ